MKRFFDETVDICLLPKLLCLICLTTILYSSAFAADYPQPRPPEDSSQYDRSFQRSMTLMAAINPMKFLAEFQAGYDTGDRSACAVECDVPSKRNELER